MRLLTLDGGATFGYAFGDPSLKAPPFSGSHVLPKDVPVTKKLIAIETWLVGLIRDNGITDVWIEEPIMPRMTSFAAVTALAGYAFMSGIAATKCGCNAYLVALQTWRSDLGLPTRGPKNVLADPRYKERFGARKSGLKDAQRQWVKDRAFEFAVKHGCTPKDDNSGDACCIWLWRQMKIRQKAEEESRGDLFSNLSV